jgi:hypothetical protein
MTARLDGDCIRLEGACPVEDAETLIGLLQQSAGATVDLQECGHLHTAVVQALLAASRPVRGAPADDFVRNWILPTLAKI